ncbi:hypothetical protein BROUX41_004008 [Berkeleyomyces rouxiae]|uniref:uncharacterized protein n=1 Tax=Berkeleyomyces rouxiae TaxID=2035830 RepID=UPI003B7834EB
MDPQPTQFMAAEAPEDTTITNSSAAPPVAPVAALSSAHDNESVSPSTAHSPSPSIPYHPVSYSAPSSRPSTGHQYNQSFDNTTSPSQSFDARPEDQDRYAATPLDSAMSASQLQTYHHAHSQAQPQSSSHMQQHQQTSRPSSGASQQPHHNAHSTQQHAQQAYDYQSRPPAASSSSSSAAVAAAAEQARRDHVVIKVGMVGDAQIGKTSLMVKYVEGSWDEDYIQTLGVNFMEKTISIRNTEITFSIWDLGGQREFVNMLPLVCNDAVAILFMFDLTRKSTLNSIKEWYRQGRGFNKTAIPILVGTKYDHFVNFPREEQEEISNQARRFAKAMRAALIFSSTSHSINVQKIFKIVLSKAFDLKCTIPEIENVGEPLLLYQNC